jgi:hypothetical protein
MGAENPEQRTDRIKPEDVVSWRNVQERSFAAHQALADKCDVPFVGQVKAISINEAIVEDRKQDQSRGCDEAIPSSIQCIHHKFWGRSSSVLSSKYTLFRGKDTISGGGLFDFRVK